MAEADLSKIVSLIMENPSLIQQISNLASESQTEEPKEDPTPDIEVASEPKINNPRRLHRTQLIGAIKPYLSPGRRKAVETMLSIMDILEITGGKA